MLTTESELTWWPVFHACSAKVEAFTSLEAIHKRRQKNSLNSEVLCLTAAQGILSYPSSLAVCGVHVCASVLGPKLRLYLHVVDSSLTYTLYPLSV